MRFNIFRRGPAPRPAVAPLTMAKRIEDPAIIQQVELGLIAITQGVDVIIDYIADIDAYMEQLRTTRAGLVDELNLKCRAGAIPAHSQPRLRAWQATDDAIEAQRASSTPPGSQSRVVAAASAIKS